MAVGGACCYYNRVLATPACNNGLPAGASTHITDVTDYPDDRFTCCGRDSPFSHLEMFFFKDGKKKASFIFNIKTYFSRKTCVTRQVLPLTFPH